MASSSGKLIANWDGSAVSAATYSEVMIAFTGISGGDSYTVQGSITGNNWYTLAGVVLATGNTVTSVAGDGIYSFPATGQIKLSKSGSASTPTINLLRKN